MADVTARFLADFSDFYTAVDKAEIKITDLSAGANTASTRLSRMADSFSGRKVIADATLMVEAIERVGGTSKLTATELQRLTRTVEEATAKAKVMGQAVPASWSQITTSTKALNVEVDDLGASIVKIPPTMTTVSTTTDKAAGSFGQLQLGAQSVDKTLGALGINISPVVGTLGELSTMATTGTAAMGKLGTAISIVGAIMAGWKLGTWVSGQDWNKADDVFSGWIDRVLNLKVAQEEQGAVQDSINLAIKRGAAANIEYAEAIQYNEQWVKSHTKAIDTSAERVNEWHRQIANVRKAGTLADLDADIKAGNSTLAEMSKEYTISERAIEYRTRQLAQSEEVQQRVTKSTDQHTAALQKMKDQMFGTGAIKAAEDYVAALGPLENIARLSAEEQKKLNTAMGQAIEVNTRLGKTAPETWNAIYTATLQVPPVVAGLTSEFTKLGEQIEINKTATMGLLTTTRDIARENQDLYDYLDTHGAGAYTGVQEGARAATTAIEQTTRANEGLIQGLYQTSNAWMTAYERAQASLTQLEMYKQAGIFVGLGTAGTGVNDYMSRAAWKQGFSMPTGGLPTAQPGQGQPWGVQVNVNATNLSHGDDIADSIVDGLRRQGVRLGR